MLLNRCLALCAVFLVTSGTDGTAAEVPLPQTEALYRQPVGKSTSILQGWGGSFSHSNQPSRYALDYDVSPGVPIVAARAGRVTRARTDSCIGGPTRAFADDANEIVIDHGDGTEALYLHLSKNQVLVSPGEYVLQGELIGYSGDPGFATKPHLHFAVRHVGGDSIKMSFVDHSGDGVPQEGSGVKAAAPCAVPAKITTRAKTLWRAVVASERLGVPDLVYGFAQQGLQKPRVSDYYYIAVFEQKCDEARRALLTRMTTLSAVTTPGVDDHMDALRYTISLKSADDADLEAALALLTETTAGWPESPAKAGKLKVLVDGLRAECLADTRKAARSYVKVMKSEGTLAAGAGRRALRRLITSYRSTYGAALDRLVYEAGKALPEDQKVVRKDTEALWRDLGQLLQAWVSHFPDERAAAKDCLAQAERKRRLVAQLAGGR